MQWDMAHAEIDQDERVSLMNERLRFMVLTWARRGFFFFFFLFLFFTNVQPVGLQGLAAVLLVLEAEILIRSGLLHRNRGRNGLLWIHRLLFSLLCSAFFVSEDIRLPRQRTVTS